MSDRVDLVILGSGSTAFAAALTAQEIQKTAVMTEERPIGGTCVNRGCLPSKNLIGAAKIIHDARNPRYRGLNACAMDLDFAALVDACHQAVEFEEPGAALATLLAAGVTIAKVQLSAALVLRDPARNAERLRPWAEDRWFHQVVARGADGALHQVPDLPEALASQDPAIRTAAEWRVHFHVPLFARELDADGALRTTQPELAALLARPELRAVEHLEIETYSFAMIPAERRAALGVPTLLDALEREMHWVLDTLAAARGAAPGC